MARKDRDIKQEEAEQNQQQEEMLAKQDRSSRVGGEQVSPTPTEQNPTVGNRDELPPHTTGAEAQTSPHKLPDAPGQPVEGTPTGQDRRGVPSRQLGHRTYTGPERRKS